jgi:hypothetical protein
MITAAMKRYLYILLFSFLFILKSTLYAAEDTPSFGLGSTPPPEVLKFLQDLKRQYGPDTVALVSWLLDAANHSGALLTTSVKVNGNETKDNSSFLVFLVDTGLILNEQKINQNERLLLVWDTILEKAFLQMDTIQVPADGVMIDVLYHHKSFPETDDLLEHVDEPGPVEEAKFYIPGDTLRAFMGKQLSSQDLLNRSQIFVGDTPVVLISPKGTQKTESFPQSPTMKQLVKKGNSGEQNRTADLGIMRMVV